MNSKSRIGMSSLLLGLLATFTIVGCQSIRDTLNSLKQLEFRLGAVNSFRLAGVDISRIQNPSNLSMTDGARLLAAFNNESLPVTFRLNVEARNPNTGTGSQSGTDIFFKKMEFTLYIDGKKTIDGTVNKRLRVPGTGEVEVIPVDMSLDLVDFFGSRGYQDLLNLAFAIGGVDGSSSKLRLGARVTVETPIGDIEYPDELTIVNTSFSN